MANQDDDDPDKEYFNKIFAVYISLHDLEMPELCRYCTMPVPIRDEYWAQKQCLQNIVKQGPGRLGKKSLSTEGVDFAKPCTSRA